MWYKVKRIYQWTNLVRPVWKPWANTVAYYPLDTDFNDYSWNWWNMTTKAGSPSITTLNGVKCCYFNGSSDIGNNDFHSSSIWTTFTVCWWVNLIWDEMAFLTNVYQPWYTWFAVNQQTSWLLFQLNKGSSPNTSIKYDNSYQKNTWIFSCVTYSNNTAKVYVNWVLGITSNSVPYATDSNWYTRIWWFNNRTSWTWERWFSNGYVSNLIIENKIWTASEVSNYYNQTKSKYWL